MEPVSDPARFNHIPTAGPGEVEQLRTELDRLRAELQATERARDLALEGYHAGEERLARVRALADFAEWADAEHPGNGAEPTVRISDLRRSLS